MKNAEMGKGKDAQQRKRPSLKITKKTSSALKESEETQQKRGARTNHPNRTQKLMISDENNHNKLERSER